MGEKRNHVAPKTCRVNPNRSRTRASCQKKHVLAIIQPIESIESSSKKEGGNYEGKKVDHQATIYGFLP